MGKKKLGKFVLTIPEPLSIETEGLGRILVSHWTVGAISDTSKIIGRSTITPKEFVTEFVGKLARIPSDDEKPTEQYENGLVISNPEDLTGNDIEKIAREYVKKWKNEILYWVVYEEEDRSNLDLDKEENESDSEYFFRILKTSVKKSEEQSRKIYEKYDYFGSTKGFLKEFTKNQQKLGAINEKIKSIRKSTFEMPSIEPLHTRIPDLPQNPVLKSNKLLYAQLSQLESLSKLVEAQGEQAVILNDQTELLLRESASSSAQAKIGVWIAAGGIILSTFLSAYSIYRSMGNEKAAIENFNSLATTEREGIHNQKEALIVSEAIKNELTETKFSINASNENLFRALEEMNLISERNSKDRAELTKAINLLIQHLAKNSTNKQLNMDASR